MSIVLTELGPHRFIGDAENMVVHDRLNEECEDCLMEVLIEKGAAVYFDPDTRDQAFEEGYDYCDTCFS